jgi:hypothetical protein
MSEEKGEYKTLPIEEFEECPEVDISLTIDSSAESFGKDLDAVLETGFMEESTTNESFFTQSETAVLKKLGFIKGAILKRSAPEVLPGVYTYGIFTGRFSNDEFKNIILHFTDGEESQAQDCVTITDVDKALFQYVAEEKDRLRAEMNEFIMLIENQLANVIYSR